MFIHGYIEINNDDFCFDIETTHFTNNIDELMDFFQYDNDVLNDIKKIWKYAKQYTNNEIYNNKYVVYMGGDEITIFVFNQNVCFYYCDEKCNFEKIENFEHWLKCTFNERNQQIVKILLNNEF